MRIKKHFPKITIERVGTDERGHVIYIDLHDEEFGEAIFFGEGVHHYHGFLNGGYYEGKEPIKKKILRKAKQ